MSRDDEHKNSLPQPSGSSDGSSAGELFDDSWVENLDEEEELADLELPSDQATGSAAESEDDNPFLRKRPAERESVEGADHVASGREGADLQLEGQAAPLTGSPSRDAAPDSSLEATALPEQQEEGTIDDAIAELDAIISGEEAGEQQQSSSENNEPSSVSAAAHPPGSNGGAAAGEGRGGAIQEPDGGESTDHGGAVLEEQSPDLEFPGSTKGMLLHGPYTPYTPSVEPDRARSGQSDSSGSRETRDQDSGAVQSAVLQEQEEGAGSKQSPPGDAGVDEVSGGEMETVDLSREEMKTGEAEQSAGESAVDKNLQGGYAMSSPAVAAPAATAARKESGKPSPSKTGRGSRLLKTAVFLIVMTGCIVFGVVIGSRIHPGKSGRATDRAAVSQHVEEQEKSRWRRLFESAMELERRGKLGRALTCFSRALDLAPDEAVLWQGRGRVLTKQQQWVRARADLERALELEPDNLKIQIDQAALLFYEGEYKQARQLYGEIIKKDSDYTDAYYGRSLCELRLQKTDSALRGFRKVLELSPSYSKAYRQIAMIYLDRDQHQEALDVLTDGIKHCSSKALLFFNRALVRYRAGAKEAALDDYASAIELEPTDKAFFNDRGFVLLDLGRYEEAAKDFEKALQLDPGYKLARENLRIARKSLGKINSGPRSSSDTGSSAE